MNILLLVARYHTNLIPLVRSLIGCGHNVRMYVVRAERTEKHEGVCPILIQPEMSNEAVEKIKGSWQPDVVVIRPASASLMRLAKQYAEIGVPVFHYDQESVLCANSLRAKFKDAKKYLKMRRREGAKVRISPVCSPRRHGRRIASRQFYYPMDVLRERLSSSYNHSVLRIMMVGKLGVPRKRHRWLIDALQSSGLPYRLTIVGERLDKSDDINNRSLEYYSDLMCLIESDINIDLKQDIAYDDVRNLYYLHDVFVHPAEDEPFAISVLEAMSAGCVTLAPKGNGSSSTLKHGENALLFNDSNYSDFSENLNKIMRDFREYINLGLEAQRFIREKHNVSSFLKCINAI